MYLTPINQKYYENNEATFAIFVSYIENLFHQRSNVL